MFFFQDNRQKYTVLIIHTKQVAQLCYTVLSIFVSTHIDIDSDFNKHFYYSVKQGDVLHPYMFMKNTFLSIS